MDEDRHDNFQPHDAFGSEAETLREVLALLATVDPAARTRILKAAEAFVGENPQTRPEPRRPDIQRRVSYSFSQNRVPELRAFLVSKRPQTDVERVACLAYYANEILGQPIVTSELLQRLNVQGGKPLSNPTNAARHAEHGGYLERIDPQSRRISPLGRSIVEHLPDRIAVRRTLKLARTK